MATVLSPKQAAILAKSAYTTRLDSDMLTAAQAASEAGGQFDISQGIRFTGISGIGNISSRTGFGYIASGSNGARQGECIIIVRGTEPTSAHDWLSDFHMSGVQGQSGFAVHKGFNKVAGSILRQIRSAIRGRNPSAMHIIGHSLGGATSTLLAEALRDVAEIKLYTFGAPRAGTMPHSIFLTSELGQNNIFRVYHDTDPVPMVPIFPFAHIPTTQTRYMLQGTGAIVSFSAHSMEQYIRNVGDSGWNGLPIIPHRRFSLETVDDVLGMATSVTSGPTMLSAHVLRLIGRALDMMLNNITVMLGSLLFVSATILDRMAAILATGVATSLAVADRVRNLIDTILRFMGRTLQSGVQITTAFIRWVLATLFDFIANMARRATAIIGA